MTAKKGASFDLPLQRIPVIATPDVCVIGGGAAGMAASVAAARCGLKVLLVEKYGFCGGATVAGLSGTICGLFSSGSRPQQIVFGFAGEFYEAMRSRSGVSDPLPFGRTILVSHDSLVWKEVADGLLSDAGVKVLFHSVFLRAFCDSGGIKTLVLKCMEGLVAIHPKVVIDASGDAEVVNDVGGATTFGDNGVVQTPTMIFRMGGVDMKKFLALDPRQIDAMVTECHASGLYELPRHHVYLFPLPSGSEVICNMTRITFPNGRVPSGLKSADMSFAEAEGRKQARNYATFLREKVPGFRNAFMVDTGAQIGIRQTRSIVGVTRLTNQQVIAAAKTPGAATFSAWPIEAHSADGVKILYFEDQCYDIPFEALIPKGAINLFAAGRCFSAEHEALASARVTAQCFGMGYAAGAACGALLRDPQPAHALSGPCVEQYMQEMRLKTSHQR